MAETSGLRPLKETNTQGNAPTHYTTMSGAYDIYVQDNLTGVTDGQDYYAAKWMKFAAGTYQVRFVFDDVGEISLDGQVVVAGSNGGTWLVPANGAFTVAADSVVRFDLHVKNSGGLCYWCYEIRKDGALIEVSRANDFVGDTIPIPDVALGAKPPYNEDVRLSYPVFLVKPNWASGIIERLEWNTDVLTSETGAEQRRKLRHVPRRSFEASFNAFGNNRSMIDSYITGVGASNGLLPLWQDEVMSTSAAAAGSIDIFADIAYREFNVNDVVIIRRNDTFDYELNVVAGIQPGHIVLALGIQQDTPAGATITPVRVANLRDQITGTILTDRVQQYGLRFYTLETADVQAAWNLPFYSRTNIPILTLPPNYRESLSLTFDRTLFTWDNEIGNVYTADPGAWSSVGEKLGYQVHGREQMYRFKQMLYAMSGRWREFHVPSGHDDIALSREISSSQGALIAHRSGYSQFGTYNQPVRKDILIELWDGTLIPNTIISSRVVGEEEWLFLAETTAAIPKEDVKRISYMPRGRLDIDAVEIQRLTDSDGASTISLTTKSLDERRVAPPVIFP